MTLTSTKVLLKKAQKGRYALSACNVSDMEVLHAVVAAGEVMKSPLIISTSEGAIRYAGLETLVGMVKVAAAHASVPVALHLDHAKDFSLIKRCIKAGYSSVMFDGSHLSFEENVKQTARVVAYARARGVSVEGELGTIGGVEDAVRSRLIIKTDPLKAKEFVKRTGVDFLAVAVGTSHGAYKFKGKQGIDLKLLKEIKRQVSIPLVLHGASGVPRRELRTATRFGAKLEGAKGVSDAQLRQAVRFGICKVNQDTDLRIGFIAGIRRVLSRKPEIFDPREVLTPAMKEVTRVVVERMKVLGSRGKA